MQVLHEYLILFTVKYFSNASSRLVEIVLTSGLLTRLQVITLFIRKTQLGTFNTTLAKVSTPKRRNGIYIFNLQQQE